MVQLPDGLRPAAFTFAEKLKALTGAEVMLSGDSCYGACDLAIDAARTVNADLIIHYGHSPMAGAPGIPVLYIEAKVDFDVEALVEKASPHISAWRRVGLVATVQHVHRLDDVAEALRRTGQEATIGKAAGRVAHDGQVLGCDYTSAQSISDKVDGFI